MFKRVGGLYIKKVFLYLCFIFLISVNYLFAINLFQEFSDLHSGIEVQIKIKGNIINIKEGAIEKTEPFQMIKSKDYTLLMMNSKNIKSLFLANIQGFFIQGQNQRSPLKIGGNYSVMGGANTADVMSFDFKKDYDIEKTISENEVLLKRIRKDVPYYNALLKKTAAGYSMDFIDRGGTVIKRGIYNLDKTSKMIKT